MMEIINLNDWFQEIWRQKSSYFIQCFKNVFQKKNGIVNQTPTDFFHPYRFPSCSEMIAEIMKFGIMYATGC